MSRSSIQGSIGPVLDCSNHRHPCYIVLESLHHLVFHPPNPCLSQRTEYLRKVTKLDAGRGESSGGDPSSDAEAVNPECCYVKKDRTRSDLPTESPTSSCSTIASALWKPLWPPGWHPRSAPPNPSPGQHPISKLKPLPLITMSHPDDRSGSVKESTPTKVVEGCHTPTDETEYIESWLDEHPAFLQNYFVRKASRSVVDAWLQARTSQSAGAPSGCSSAPASGATTPVRKVSAHEFEQGSLFLRPMVSTTSDGTPTFLPLITSESTSDLSSVRRRKTRQELEGMCFPDVKITFINFSFSSR